MRLLKKTMLEKDNEVSIFLMFQEEFLKNRL